MSNESRKAWKGNEKLRVKLLKADCYNINGYKRLKERAEIITERKRIRDMQSVVNFSLAITNCSFLTSSDCITNIKPNSKYQ